VYTVKNPIQDRTLFLLAISVAVAISFLHLLETIISVIKKYSIEISFGEKNRLNKWGQLRVIEKKDLLQDPSTVKYVSFDEIIECKVSQNPIEKMLNIGKIKIKIEIIDGISLEMQHSFPYMHNPHKKKAELEEAFAKPTNQ
jgi:hypothetical protein